MNETILKTNQLMTPAEVKELILQGNALVLSGEESLLKELPKGNWIGGTIPYFYLQGQNGRMDKEHIFVTNFSDHITDSEIRTYNNDDISNVCLKGFDNGFHFMILPALQKIHLNFALNAPSFPNLMDNPLVGLIAGADLDEFSKGKLARVFNGATGKMYSDEAVVLHASLPPGKVARLEIINVFEPDATYSIEVPEDTFTVTDCIINGKVENLYDFIFRNKIDISYPLIADYAGAKINTSFQRLDAEKHQVVFYGPLFKGKIYNFAKPVQSYTHAFEQKIKTTMSHENQLIFNCNCILNYLYGELDKHDIGFSGPTTFGEVAYNLLNQTFTYLTID